MRCNKTKMKVGNVNMELIENMLTNGTELTFSILFIGMLLYVIKKNDEREKQYQETIDKNQTIIRDTVNALNGYEDLKADLQRINDKLSN